MAELKYYLTREDISRIRNGNPLELKNHGFTFIDKGSEDAMIIYHDSGTVIRATSNPAFNDNEFGITSNIPNGIETAKGALEGLIGGTLTEIN